MSRRYYYVECDMRVDHAPYQVTEAGADYRGGEHMSVFTRYTTREAAQAMADIANAVLWLEIKEGYYAQV